MTQYDCEFGRLIDQSSKETLETVPSEAARLQAILVFSGESPLWFRSTLGLSSILIHLKRAAAGCLFMTIYWPAERF
jgi:hypothetical protein